MKMSLLSIFAVLATVSSANAKTSNDQCFREAQVASFKAVIEQLDEEFSDLSSVSLKEAGTTLKSKSGLKNTVIVSIIYANKFGSQVEQATVELTESHDNKCVVNKISFDAAE